MPTQFSMTLPDLTLPDSPKPADLEQGLESPRVSLKKIWRKMARNKQSQGKWLIT